MADVAFGATPVQSDAQILADQVSSWRKEIARLEGLIAVATGSPSPDTVVIRREEVEALRKDAARYRWLKGNAAVIFEETQCWPIDDHRKIYSAYPAKKELDAAIDAALTKEQGNG